MNDFKGIIEDVEKSSLVSDKVIETEGELIITLKGIPELEEENAELKEEHKGKCKTAYIKGIRTMANALKDYDRTDGAWTDYFEHTVDKVLKKLLGEIEK